MTTETNLTAHRGAGLMRLPRSRGAISGLLLILLGVWGAIIPFIGPYFDYAYTPDTTWTWTSGRFVLEVLPGAAAVLGGLLLLTTANRVVAVFGGWLASAAGVWFVVGPILGTLWGGSSGATGMPVGDHTTQVVERIGFFFGLGAAILLLAAHASGRLSVRAFGDVRAAERRRAASVERHEPVREPVREHVREPVHEPVGEPVADEASAPVVEEPRMGALRRRRRSSRP